ncbi:MAG: iron-sulfur cluster carrier protein MrpORP [Vulcanimicrobiota bacterium]
MHSCTEMEQEHSRIEQDRQIEGSLSQIKRTLVVMSGKGGVGKSTVAVNLAVALAGKGKTVGLMDVDLHGPSVPTLLGIQGKRLVSGFDRLLPFSYTDNLKVLSIANLMDGKDEAVIWRGPMKAGAIRQFLSDVEWGSLDFLVIDSPPGTGDEPLTIAQTITGGEAIIVTTPQELSLADVRRCVSFCRKLSMPILGIIENMSGFLCPHCHNEVTIFRKGGGEEAAHSMGIPFLGSIPIDPAIVLSSDEGKPFLAGNEKLVSYASFQRIVEKIAAQEQEIKEAGIILKKDVVEKSREHNQNTKEVNKMKYAVPLANGILCAHFGHCEQFAVMSVENKKILSKELVTPPPHEPGVLPEWLSSLGVSVVIAGGMGSRAQELFRARDIEVIVGASEETPEELIEKHLEGALKTGQNVCDH